MIKSHFLATTLLLFLPSLASADLILPDVTMEGHTHPVCSVAFSHDGKHLASVDNDGNLKLWDVGQKKEIGTLDCLTSDGNPIKWSADGKTIYLLSRNNSVAVIDAETAKLRKMLAFPTLPSGATAVDVSPDGKTLAVVGRSTLLIADATTGDVQHAWTVHENYGIPSVAFAPDGKHVATTSDDDTALLIEPATGTIPQTFKLDLKGVLVLFDADAKHLLAYTTNGTLTAFDVATGDSKTLDERGPYNTIVLSPDGKTVVLAGNGLAPSLLPLSAGKMAEQLYTATSA